MPTAKSVNNSSVGNVLAIIGEAGSGKSHFAAQAPQPHAILAIDKPALVSLPSWFPDYDPSLSFGRFYPPPDVNLIDEKALPPRNVFDEIWRDVLTLREALKRGEPSFKIGNETWPLPKTIIIDGGDFVRSHCTNWILNTHKKYHMDEFLSANGAPNAWLGWGLVAEKMIPFYKSLTFLPSVRPVNVIVTIGISDETKTEKINGKPEQIATGKKLANFGGKKLDQEAPRSFHNMWLAHTIGGRYYLATAKGKKFENYAALRSNRVGIPMEPDVTLEQSKPQNFWNLLFAQT